MDPIGVYIHVPYCRVACPYCDFVKKATRGDAPDAFVGALCREIAAFDGPDVAASVFFGGGTPSLLTPAGFAAIMSVLRQRFRMDNPEVSVEVNPDDVSPDRLDAWVEAGVARVNLGVQSFDDRVLKYFGRCHDAADARRACEAVASRFENWGIDLIFGGRPHDAWGETLAECLRFAPPHVSTYGLTFEEGTPFWKRRAEAIDDDIGLELYREGDAALVAYDHYEVSNFALPGFECRHNLIYWRNAEYAGFGPGAYSYLDGVRARNAPDIDGYLRAPGAKSESLRLSDREIKVETLIQHFRTRRGLPRADYVARFGATPEAEFAAPLAALAARGLIEEEGDSLRPTRTGYELNNEIGLAIV